MVYKRLFNKLDLDGFIQTCKNSQTLKIDYPNARVIEKRIPIYYVEDIIKVDKYEIMEELHKCLKIGPGVYILKNLLEPNKVETASRVADDIIKDEKVKFNSRGDHFAVGGKNDRIWNFFQKHALQNPKSFCEYYDNSFLDLVFESWLGPGWELTSQLNVVKPGGKAQEPHRDYHLGFQTPDTTNRFPSVTQIATQLLTLQGAIAHSDMPIESGPTLLLPFSQKFESGYVYYREKELVDYFKQNAVSLPMSKGDSIFFNPALHHAAGENLTEDIQRSANLLQISSAFGKPMETVDRELITRTVWNDILERHKNGIDVDTLIKVIGEGYSLPTNLDLDPPLNGGCPPTQQDLIHFGIKSNWSLEQVRKELHDRKQLRLP